MSTALVYIFLLLPVVAGLIVFRRSSVLGVLTRGIAVWRTWRAVVPWLERIGPGLRRAGTPRGR